MGMQPLADSILIRPDEPKTKTDSGIFIKEAWETRPPTGMIEEIGPDVTDVDKGDRVVFMRYGSTETNDKNLRLIKQSHVLAKINE